MSQVSQDEGSATGDRPSGPRHVRLPMKPERPPPIQISLPVIQWSWQNLAWQVLAFLAALPVGFILGMLPFGVVLSPLHIPVDFVSIAILIVVMSIFPLRFAYGAIAGYALSFLIGFTWMTHMLSVLFFCLSLGFFFSGGYSAPAMNYALLIGLLPGCFILAYRTQKLCRRQS